jgi:YegS/Rv2252/BmrU family lipid kinase
LIWTEKYMKKTAHLIFNPVSGQGNAEQELASIASILSAEFDLKVYQTTPAINAKDLAIQAVAQQADLVIAAGGDGTVSAVAGQLLETGIPLGVIARGTANAFANALSIPTDVQNACQTILAGNTQAVDVAICNGHPMLLLAGIGLEANAIAAADREVKDRFGVLAYIMAGIQQLQEIETFAVTIETEDRILKCQASAITVANAAPPTSILAQGPDEIVYNDGLLDITIFAPTNTLDAAIASYHLLRSALESNVAKCDHVGYFRTHAVRITTDPPQKVVVDGELIDADIVEVRTVSLGLQLFVPGVIVENSGEDLSGLQDLVTLNQNNFALANDAEL